MSLSGAVRLRGREAVARARLAKQALPAGREREPLNKGGGGADEPTPALSRTSDWPR
jgi:hypothetical protein